MYFFERNKLWAALFACFAATSLFAQQAAVAPKPAVTPAATTNVTTSGGTSGLLPVFNGTSSITNSVVYANTTGIGINRGPATGAALDVQGTTIYRGIMDLSRQADATTTMGQASWPFRFNTSAYNSYKKADLGAFFELEAEPTGNNTLTTGATLNLRYNNGNVTNVSETGLYFNGDGTIHFAAGQTFPIASNGITAVTHDSSLTGSGTSASPLGLAAVAHDSTIVGNGTSASPLSLPSPLNLPGSAYAKGFYGSNYTANYAAVEGDDYSNDGVGVEGLSFNEGSGYAGYGMVAEGYIGIYAYGSHYAGDFDGNVYVGGTLSKAGGSFKIDHPLDPENKYLSHSFVESPDMMNIYNGNVTTDSSGMATVTMPDWFEALNQDFRYQLTPIGQFSQAIVASEIENNTFTIRTDKPNVKVSWMVTGVRHDAWANAHRIPNEEEKTEAEKGHYLHPELFKHPGEPAIGERSLPLRH